MLQLTTCLKALLAAIQAGDTAGIREHLIHVVLKLTVYVATKLDESLGHDDNDPITFGSDGETTEMLATAQAVASELSGEPMPMSGPISDWVLANLVQLIIAKLADTGAVDEFVQKQLDALVALLEKWLGK